MSVVEGSGFTLSLGGVVDVAADNAYGFKYAFDCGSTTPGGPHGYGAWGTSASASCAASPDNMSRQVWARVKDRDGGISEYTSTVGVSNAAPTATVMSPLNGTTYATGQTVIVYLSFKDLGKNDSHTCSADWGDGATSSGTVSETLGSGSGTCTLTHVYATVNTSPGYTIRATVTDKDGGSVTATVLVYVAQAKTKGSSSSSFLSYRGAPSAPAVVKPKRAKPGRAKPARAHRAKAKAKPRRHAAQNFGWVRIR
jgi:hypothetical protein